MSKIIVLGGGMCGLEAGMLPAGAAHPVTLVERDSAPGAGTGVRAMRAAP